MRHARRGLVAAGGLALVACTTAFAHVEVASAPNAKAAALGEVVVSVPNESADADTTSVTVRLPENVVRAEFPRVAGWRSFGTTVSLASPVQVGDRVVTTRVATVTWTGGRIRPGQRAEFRLRVRVGKGSKRSGLTFAAVQRYSDGTVVRWIGPPGSDKPAGVLQAPLPVVAVTPAPPPPEPVTTPPTASAPTTAPASDENGGNRGLAIGLIAAAAVALGGGAIALGRRRRNED